MAPSAEKLLSDMIQKVYQDMLNGTGDDDLVWLLSDRAGMVGRLKYLDGGVTRVKLCLAEQVFDWEADIEDLVGFRLISDETEIVVSFLLPGNEKTFEETVEWATDISQRFFKLPEN